jgi:hypothetical protein
MAQSIQPFVYFVESYSPTKKNPKLTPYSLFHFSLSLSVLLFFLWQTPGKATRFTTASRKSTKKPPPAATTTKNGHHNANADDGGWNGVAGRGGRGGGRGGRGGRGGSVGECDVIGGRRGER